MITITQSKSVYKGEVAIVALYGDDGELLGELWGTGGVLSFTGNAEESARVFFEQVVRCNMEYLEDK